MKTILLPEVERGRCAGVPGDGPYGAFFLVHPITGRRLKIIASDGRDWEEGGLPGLPWEHVSVSTEFGVPRYEEMRWVKGLFWEHTECVVEFHVPAAEHVNIHPNVLHLWRQTGGSFPVPPKECV